MEISSGHEIAVQKAQKIIDSFENFRGLIAGTVTDQNDLDNYNTQSSTQYKLSDEIIVVSSESTDWWWGTIKELPQLRHAIQMSIAEEEKLTRQENEFADSQGEWYE